MAEISALEDLLAKFKQGSLAVSFIINGSQAMRNDWELVRLLLRELVDRLVGDQTAFSLVLIGTRSEVAQEFTTDVKAFNLKISSLALPGGNAPNIGDGLSCGHNLLRIYPNQAARRLAIVVTNTGEAPGTIARMKNDSISVVSIATGPNVELQKVAALASNVGYSFGCTTLPALRLLFLSEASSLPLPVLEVARVQDNAVTLSVLFKSEGVKEVTLQKHSLKNGWEDCMQKLVAGGDQCSLEMEGLEPSTSYEYRVILRFASGHQLPSRLLKVTTQGANSMTKLLKDSEKLKGAINILTKKIIEFTNTFKYPVRIGLVGKVGSGKSAAANSYHSVFKKSFVVQSVVGILGEKSLTSKPKQIPLPQTNLILTDFFGWDNPKNYESDLKYLIQGLAPEDLKDGDTASNSYSTDSFVPFAERRKFYGIFIIVSPSDVHRVEILERVQSLYDLVNQQGLQPVILLTKVDEIDPELADHPELVYASDKVENYIKQLLIKRFNRRSIFPVISYFEPPFNNELNDVKNYLLLSALYSLIFHNMQSRLEDVIRPEQPKEANIQDEVQSISESVKTVSLGGSIPPGNVQSVNERCTLLVRQAGIEEAFKKCRLSVRTLEALRKAICAQFHLASMPLFIYETKGNPPVKVSIENDDDVVDLANESTLEFA